MTQTASPTIVPVTCPSCAAPADDGHTFCQQCGERLTPDGPERQPAPAARPQATPGLGNLAAQQHRKHIRSARVAIMVVAVLTVLSAVAYWMMLDAEIAKVRADPTMVVIESAVREARLLIGVTFVIGLLFVGLFFWAKRNPFGATLTALIVYLTSIAGNAAYDPTTLAKGWLVKAIVIACLVKGVQAGFAYKKVPSPHARSR